MNERLDDFGEALSYFSQGTQVGYAEERVGASETRGVLNGPLQVNLPIPIDGFPDQSEVEAVEATYSENGYRHAVVRLRNEHRTRYYLRLIGVQ